MLSMLIAYDEEGRVTGTLESLVARDDDGNVLGLVDFERAEADGMALTDIWTDSGAAGSGSWPEWLDARELRAQDYRVELEPGWSRRSKDRGPARIRALVRPGDRRDRQEIKSRIAQRISAAGGKPADIRDIVGGPTRPLRLTGDAKPHRPAPRFPVVRPGRTD